MKTILVAVPALLLLIGTGCATHHHHHHHRAEGPRPGYHPERYVVYPQQQPVAVYPGKPTHREGRW